VAMLRASLRVGLVAHAHLLVGPGGVGRLGIARELAAVLLCGEGEGGRCGVCKGCYLFDAGRHPDYHEVGVPEDKQELPIATVRELQHEAGIKPILAQRRVFVVRDADRMNIAAANCFLKTLEEPPGQCCFILIASNLWDIPETIVSRCRVVKLAGLPPREVEAHLRDEGVAEDDAWWLARRTWGSPGLARLFNDVELQALNRRLAEAACSLGARDNFALTDMLLGAVPQSATRAEGRALLQELLECLAVLYRDMAALSVAGEDVELFNREASEALRQMASRRSTDDLTECADLVLDAIDRIGANANQRIVLDDLFSQLARVCAGGDNS